LDPSNLPKDWKKKQTKQNETELAPRFPSWQRVGTKTRSRKPPKRRHHLEFYHIPQRCKFTKIASKHDTGTTTTFPFVAFLTSTVLFRFHVSNGFSFCGLKRVAAFLFLVWKQKCRETGVSRFERSNGFAIENTELLVHHDMVSTFPRKISAERTHRHLKSNVLLREFVEVDAPIDKKTIDL
jgi:hypothetical protein